MTKLAAGTSSSVENETVGAISVRMYGPIGSEHPVPALLWIHGGGFVMGTAAQDDAACRHFAAALGIVVVAPEYRLAPEHQFPQPLHDCYEVLGWLSRQPYVDRTRIAVGGGSAGGGLAAALALLAHERGEIPLAFQLLAYPMLDDRTALRVDIDEHNFRMWNNKANRFGWLSYLGSLPGSAVSGLAAPARYGDLSGLPPAWIGVGTLDLFYDEDLAYADRLNSAGVPASSMRFPAPTMHLTRFARRRVYLEGSLPLRRQPCPAHSASEHHSARVRRPPRWTTLQFGQPRDPLSSVDQHRWVTTRSGILYTPEQHRSRGSTRGVY